MGERGGKERRRYKSKAGRRKSLNLCATRGDEMKGMRLTNGTYGLTIHESNREDRVDGMN